MRQMPIEIKNKLRQYARAQLRSSTLYDEVQELLESYNMNVDNFLSTGDGEVQTEGLAFINNCEVGNIESTISEIEKVFLYYINQEKHGDENEI